MRQVPAIFTISLLGLTSAIAQDCAGPMPGPCSLLKSAVIFVGKVVEKENRFQVTEAFKGIKGGYVDVVDIFGQHFEVGQQYIFFGYWMEGGDGTRYLVKSPCSPTAPVACAPALLKQLRAERSGRRVAAVYGTLVRSLQEYGGGYVDYDPLPLSNIVVRLQSEGKSFETRTDDNGVYAFDRLPPGKYHVSADLPPNLLLGQIILEDPVPPFDLPPRSCFDNDLYA